MDRSVIEEIRLFAEEAHKDQKRKFTEENFIRHPERVMSICRNYTTDVSILSAALLHDVLEDTSVTEEELRNFLLNKMEESLAIETTNLVIDLTDIYTKENYPQYNRKKRKELEAKRLFEASPKAQTVKYADLIDNATDIVNHDPNFAKVFLREGKLILEMIDKGYNELYLQAQRVINTGLSKLYP